MLGRLSRWFDGTLHPAWYHGETKRPPFFEGWYFKLISPDRSLRYAIIPGIFLSDDPARHHAFVQVFDGVTGHVTYHRYPATEFRALAGEFDIRIGPNRFTRQGLELHIDDELRTVEGQVQFGAGQGWPISVRSPGVMGWFGWVPIMECYHGVLSFDHALDGGLTVDGAPHDFSGGRGYIEKDWGRSFPGGWVWMQTNHFETPGISFSASIAIIPFARHLVSRLPGRSFDQWCVLPVSPPTPVPRPSSSTSMRRRSSGRSRTTHTDWRSPRRGQAHRILPGPTTEDMNLRVPETLQASIEVRLTPKAGGPALFHGTGECAGLEVAGDIERLRGAIHP